MDIVKQLREHIEKTVDVKEPTLHENVQCQKIKMDWFYFECNRCQNITPENKNFCEKICQIRADKFAACAIRHEWYKLVNNPPV